ncbi:MAG: hypothetical protein ACRDBH_07730 [Bosea sp. (in: a-proteobacteria)]
MTLRSIPLGANYWDVYLYLDAAWRVIQGQMPHTDFFVACGALPFYLFAAVFALAPDAQPLLAAQYSILLLALPLMLIVAKEVARAAPLRALAVVLPFAIGALLPINMIEFFPSPGTDGIGLYNRQSGLVLYPLVAALLLMPASWARTAVIAISASALFYIKVNSFAAAIGFCGYVFLAGRLSWRDAIASGLFFLGSMAVVELSTGLVSSYIADIRAMLEHNSGALFTRLLTLASVKLDVLAMLALLGIALVFFRSQEALQNASGPIGSTIAKLLRQPAVELIAFTGIACINEAQNTGSQEFLYLWPLLLLRLGEIMRWPPTGKRTALLFLIIAATLPSMVKMLHRAGRAIVVAPGYHAINLPILGPYNSVRVKPAHLERARELAEHFPKFKATYASLAEQGQMSSSIVYSEPDFQAYFLIDAAQAATALLAREATLGRRYDSLYTLEFVDVMPLVLKRVPVRGLSVAYEPMRGYPRGKYPEMLAALSKTDAILVPHCPDTPARLDMMEAVNSVIKDRNRIALTACWDLYERP